MLHGFKQYVLARDGAAAWDDIVQRSGAEGWYQTTRTYPDQELGGLIQAAAARWGRSVEDILGEYGKALVPTLMKLYGSFVHPDWRTLDLLTYVEAVIHRTVRLRDSTASPPRLQTCRISATEVEIVYSSERKLCALAAGICHGVAQHYGETISIEQPECMNQGAARCRLVVRLVSGHD